MKRNSSEQERDRRETVHVVHALSARTCTPDDADTSAWGHVEPEGPRREMVKPQHSAAQRGSACKWMIHYVLDEAVLWAVARLGGLPHWATHVMSVITGLAALP